MSSRRDFIGQLSAFGLALAGVPRLPLWLRPRFVASPFTLGLASGDPLPDGVVLWTRLAPDPVSNGGMPPEAVQVRWELADDEAMRHVVQRGTVTARPDLAHSVHAEVGGLQPARNYWYRFDVGGEASPVGRTRTAPAAGASPERLRFAFASCQHWEQGFYAAYRHLAEEDLELVLHVGDYIYEHDSTAAVVRHHATPEPVTLAGYRNRYGQYKADPALQAAHAAFPWVVTWDDHEVENNYAGAFSSDTTVAPATFLLRRAAAYQAYYEHQPLRKASLPHGPDALLYRSLAFGSLARFHVLDTRQYRSDQSCGDGMKRACPAWSDTTRVMLGDAQERWLHRGVEQSRARWSVLAQQVAFAPIFAPSRPDVVAMDPWSGYPAARDRLIAWMASRRDRDFVILSGDIHANFVMDVTATAGDATTPTVATEFIGTSITSNGDGSDRWPQYRSYETDMPTMKYHDARRGYVRCEVTADTWRSDYRVLPHVHSDDAPIETRASLVVHPGHPGAERA